MALEVTGMKKMITIMNIGQKHSTSTKKRHFYGANGMENNGTNPGLLPLDSTILRKENACRLSIKYSVMQGK
jgi:hypothetical protein